MEPVNLKEIIIDSLKYSASDLKMLVLLGIVLLLADTAEGLNYVGVFANEMELVLLVIVIIMAIFEAGYVFRILLETIKGSTKLPKFNNLKLMFFSGVTEIVILILYFSIPIVFFGLFYLNFLISMDFNTLPVVSDISILIILSLTVIIYIFFPAVLLHRAHNEGKFRSSFEFKNIYHKIRSVGFHRLVVVYLGLFIIVSMVKIVLVSTVSDNIPLIGDIIPDLIIAPYLLIFTTRVLGLIDTP
jgi:Protein of unknown function (DUF4013)